MPLAIRYKTEALLQKCLNALLGFINSGPNSTLCLALNMGVSLKFQPLKDVILDFLKEKNRVLALMHSSCADVNKNLDPKSVIEILKIAPKNSLMADNVLMWGVNYLEKNNKTENLKEFLTEEKVSEFFDCCDFFETHLTFLIYLNNSPVSLKYFNYDDLKNYMAKKKSDNRTIYWHVIEAGEEFNELLKFKNVSLASGYDTIFQLSGGPFFFVNSTNSELELELEAKIIIPGREEIFMKSEPRGSLVNKEMLFEILYKEESAIEYVDVDINVKIKFHNRCFAVKSESTGFTSQSSDLFIYEGVVKHDRSN